MIKQTEGRGNGEVVALPRRGGQPGAAVAAAPR